MVGPVGPADGVEAQHRVRGAREEMAATEAMAAAPLVAL